jgi:hypothetical protein
VCNKRNSSKIDVGIKFDKKVKVDKCMENLIITLNNDGHETLACCCGHGKYAMSIIILGDSGEIFDLISGVDIPRKKRFYKKDKNGIFYIPEIE